MYIQKQLTVHLSTRKVFFHFNEKKQLSYSSTTVGKKIILNNFARYVCVNTLFIVTYLEFIYLYICVITDFGGF